MSKVVIDDSKLVNIADAIRNKNGSANKYTPTEMATAIGDIKVSTGMELAPEDLVFSGNCNSNFYQGKWDWFLEKFGDKITTKDITSCASMFYGCTLSSIPFDINIKDEATVDLYQMFNNTKLTTLPQLKALNNYYSTNLYSMFYNCTSLVEIPKDYFDKFNFSKLNNTNYCQLQYMFGGCIRLRRIALDLSKFYTLGNSQTSQFYYQNFRSCYVLDELTNLPVPPETVIITNNLFSSAFDICRRLKKLTFSLNNGTSKTASWQKQTIDLSIEIGYSAKNWPLSDYGMPSDTEITDDASYQLLKDNEDSWTRNIAYSRYNHDSAVETINTLPDTSAYLAESGGTTNIIKFKGESGSATDGGAINTLTEAEIAVAAAKGWTVTLV